MQSIGSTYLYGFVAQHGVVIGPGYDHTYGWFSVTMDSASTFTLNSYGYNSTKNAAAIAGQGAVAGVPDTGSTAALLGAGVVALAFARRRLG